MKTMSTKMLLVLAVLGLALGKPAPQGYWKPTQGATGGQPQRNLWLTIDDNSLEVFNPLNPSPAFKSNVAHTKGNSNFYYDNSGELNIIPDPAMVSQVYSQFYSGLPVQGPNAPRYYIDSSGELGVASDHSITRLVQSNQNANLYRDNSGELLYVYPKGSHPGNSPSGTPAAAGSSAVQAY